MNTKIILLLCAMLLTVDVQGQDVEEVLKKDFWGDLFDDFKTGNPFSISGNLSLGFRQYSIWGAPQRQSPFNFTLNAGATAQFYQLRVPVSLVFNGRNTQFSSPFTSRGFEESIKNRYFRAGASPYYKWIKLHLGHRTMSFSPLTYASHMFLGAGVELNPGKIRIAGLTGLMAQTQPQSLSIFDINREIFDRRGWGMKVGYGTQETFLDLIAFQAEDRLDRFADNPFNLDSLPAFPLENVVLGLNGRATLGRLAVYGEVATSYLTENRNAPDAADRSFLSDFLMDANSSTSAHSALNLGWRIQLKRLQFGMDYRRIDDGYRSLGTYFFQDDLENTTAQVSLYFLKRKLSLRVSGGVQRNNLSQQNATDLRRTIGSLSLSYAAKATNVNLVYSNFTNRLEYVLNANLDSLNAVVVSQDAGLDVSHTIIGATENRHNFNASIHAQVVRDDASRMDFNAESDLITANLTYNYIPKQSGWRWSARINYNRNQLDGFLLNRYGLGGGVSRSFMDKQMTAGLKWNYYLSRGDDQRNTLNSRFTVTYKVSKRHTLRLNVLLLQQGANNNGPPFTELSNDLRYAYRF